MNYDIYRSYVASRKMVDALEAAPDECEQEELELLSDMKLSNTVMDEIQPDYPARYNREQTMFASFTPEQQDFICGQIGWWYEIWRDKMWIDGEQNTHWLGRGKEELKTMICGD